MKHSLNQQLLTCLLVCITVIGFTACSKDDDNNPTRRELLMEGTWKMTAYTTSSPIDYNGDGTSETDIYSVYEACNKDDLFDFNPNGILLIDEGPLKCDASDPQTFDVSWALVNNDNTLVIDGDDHTILELSASTLRISVNWGVTHTISFRH